MDLYTQAEMLITTGDLRFSDFAGLEASGLHIPSFGVYGNHDDGSSYLEDHQMENVHNRVADFNGIKIGGFMGCPRYNTREMQYTEAEAKAFSETFPYVDVLILHAGPFGLLDDQSDAVHTGSKHILNYVDQKKPKFIFCGHQYSDDQMEYNDIKIFRTYGARLIDIVL